MSRLTHCSFLTVLTTLGLCILVCETGILMAPTSLDFVRTKIVNTQLDSLVVRFYLKESWARLKLWNLSHVTFFLVVLEVLSLTSSELIFFYSLIIYTNFIFLYIDNLLSHQHLWEKLSFLRSVFLTTLSKTDWPLKSGYISSVYVLFQTEEAISQLNEEIYHEVREHIWK